MNSNLSGLPKRQKPTMKIILVGNSCVGKTCLISAYFKQSFDFQSPETVAPAYSCSEVIRNDGKHVSLQIWDTAGQERYHSVSKLFFREADIAFVCFESGDKESTSKVPDWVKKVHNEVPTCKIFFVMTKADLHTDEEIQHFVSNAETEFRGINGKIFVTSALSKLGIDELFKAAAETCETNDHYQTCKLNTKKEDKKKGCC